VAGGIDWKGPGWWGGCVTGSAGFAGRERELSSLRGALGDDTRLLLVTGDAGVGKTRFVAEGMRRAAARGMVTVMGGCLPLAGKLPLLPIADAVGELSRLDDGRLLEAALGVAPQYVRAEVRRLLPQLGASEPGPGSRGEGWQRERLFSGVGELLEGVAGGSALGVVIEDVHWADSATLDCLTYLARAGRRDALTLVVTCRGDEVPLDAQVAGWLAHVRGSGGVEEIVLGPLSRAEVAEQIAGLVGGPPPGRLVDDLYARAEGNPFFTEQLAAAALAGPAGGGLASPAGLPARLAELLAARAAGCGADAGAVLAGLAVAGRPLSEDLLCEVTGLDVDAVRGGLRELTAARLLAASTAEGEHRPRHALLAEAVAAGLLPGERVVLHERTARALDAAGGGTPAAEAAGHWAAAGRATEELRARVAAAEAAEQVFGYAEAAGHWLRAVELCQRAPDVPFGADVPRLYVRALDALRVSGDVERAGALAEEAYRRFAGHPDPATAAVICQRAAYLRRIDTPGAGLPLIEEALRLFEQAPPSADHAEAWCVYGSAFLIGEGRLAASLRALNHALQIAEAAGATAVIPRCLANLADLAFMRGQVQEGFALLDRGRALAHASQEDAALLGLAVNESDALLKLGEFKDATRVALRGLQAASQTGLNESRDALQLTDNASQTLLARGRTAEAAALIDPLTTGPPDRAHRVVHERRAEIDLLRGDIDAALGRQEQINALIGHPGIIDLAREAGQRTTELALWAGRPADALQEARRVLTLFETPDLTIFCGRLLATGMRACADLAERARARHDDHAAAAALAAGADLVSWTDTMAGIPFTNHPLVATIPADRATWDAERTRLAGASDPAAWSAAAKTWDGMGCPHPAGYAWWRHAEAQLTAGLPRPAAIPLQAAAAAAEGHAPLLAQVRALAQRARIPLQAPPAASSQAAHPPGRPTPYGLTARELDVLRLLTAGRTNAQIGAELYISPKTASVHVTSILRKLDVSGRVQAAALAERAGLLRPAP
jgi:DNA-binding CsgD family transcriptional regulator/tetratricopeptide (TPR) repeat protein